MRPIEQNYSDTLFQHRWETLRSVDDMIEAVWDEVVAAGEDDNTYVFRESRPALSRMLVVRLALTEWCCF
jgi:arylsulfatase A-like enzyme